MNKLSNSCNVGFACSGKVISSDLGTIICERRWIIERGIASKFHAAVVPMRRWQKLTRRTYGSGSGGEKAIALTLPQLAAAAAYYQTADKHAPRFILLDEAFAGISPDMRESCMELIAAFDLDVVMTSENEWGCYAGVPQLAICQLDRFAGINAVINRVYVWNGKQKQEAANAVIHAARQRQLRMSEKT